MWRRLRANLDRILRFARIYRHFGSSIRKQRRRLLLAFLSTFGFMLMRLAEPWPLKVVFDNLLTDTPLRLPVIDQYFPDLATSQAAILGGVVTAVLIIAVLRGIFYYYQNILTARAGQEVVFDIRGKLFSHLQRLSLAFHDRRDTGDLMMRLTGDIRMLRDTLVAGALSLLSSVLLVAGMVTIMFILNWRLTAVALVVVPVLLFLMHFYTLRIRKAASEQRKKEGKVASAAHEALSLIKVVQIFNRQEQEEGRFRAHNRSSLRQGLKITRMEARFSQFTGIILAGGTAVVLLLGVQQVLAGSLTPGGLLVFLAYARHMYAPLRRSSKIVKRMGRASACADRVVEVLNTKSEVQDLPKALPAPPFQGRVEFDHVAFDYVPGIPALRDISFEVKAGQRVGLVGATGSGKTTAVSLLIRLYDVSSGCVRIDGIDVRDMTLESLRGQVSVVPQEAILFRASIRENIAYGKVDASDDEIEAAAKAANTHDFIIKLPQGYETVVGERGATLSGGQRQCIAIARAVIRQAPILILDEPTSGLDARSEELVMEAFERLTAVRTTFVISHRLSLIRPCDVILVFRDGRIVEGGMQEELVATPAS